MSELTLDVDPGKLSPRSRAAYDLIATEIAAGIKPSELAQSLGVAPSWVSDQLAALRLEILFSQGAFPPLPQDEYEALCTSIVEHGVLVPIIKDEKGETIDGRHREMAAAAVGAECPVEIHTGLTLREKRELSITLNAGRRHMTTAEKRMLATAELMHDQNRSDREIARAVGVDHKTVGKLRREIEIAEGVYAETEPTDDDEQVVAKLDTLPEKVFGVAECPCCKNRLRVLKVRGELVLEAF
jgi:hypothetical protein